jgi:hypothetical protein
VGVYYWHSVQNDEKLNEKFDLSQFGSLWVKCQFLSLRSATFINFFFFLNDVLIMDKIYNLKSISKIVTYHEMNWWTKHFPLNFRGLNAIKVRVSWCVRSHSFLSHCLSVNFSLPPSLSLSLSGGEGRWP